MSQLKLVDENWVKTDDLKAGHLYLYKDGRLVVYIGRNWLNEFVFYELANCLYVSTGDWHTDTLAHYDVQVKALVCIANELMNRKLELKNLLQLKGMPKLYCEFPYCNYDSTIEDWWKKNKLSGVELPELTQNVKKNAENIYVSAKNLVPGELYYTGSLWRSLYLYLGRDSQKRFCWYFVGSAKILMRNNPLEYMSNCERTKSNKKVKRLEFALQDPKAYVYDEAKDLINRHWKANLRGIDLG